MKIELRKPFASNGGADEADTRVLKIALNRLGYYTPYAKTGMTGIPDRQVFAALEKFQKDSDLRPTGTAAPGNETIAALNAAMENAGSEGRYTWRTAGDDKVRDSHAKLNGTVRSWGQSPAPGEDYNCRCWAEPVSDEIEKEELPPPKIEEPKIPGTNIPDRGVPEQGWPGSRKYDPYRPSPDPKMDPGIIITPPKGSGPRMPIYEEPLWPSNESDV